MLVSFEGIDGSGKSTQALRLQQRLEAEGFRVLLVREPGGTALSEGVRSLLLDPAMVIEPLAELLLFSAARAQLVRERIMPALEAGTIVLCDRFFDSTTVYQGVGRGLDDDGWLASFNLRVTGGLRPLRTYLVDVDSELAHQRRAGRHQSSGQDRMEQVSPAFYLRLTSAYRSLAAAEPDRWRVLDGKASVEALHEVVWQDLSGLLPRNTPA